MKTLSILREWKLVTGFVILMQAQIYAQTYRIVDTGQHTFYGNSAEISAPSVNESFYGQDAQVAGNQPSYTDNGDGTITDNVTGLMWQKAVGEKMSLDEALAAAETVSLAGYDDWRLPSIKELYSLILFSGLDPSGWNGSNTSLLTPFLETDYFEFAYGDESIGERIIDAQYVSSTKYVFTTMMNDETVFGVNFADGRIKGYPSGPIPGQTEDKQFFVKYVRGNPNYSVNQFVNNDNGTIDDLATGLMWQSDDSESGLNWEEALSWVQLKNAENYLGYNDWRLPNVKELQSIVDYTRSPKTTGTAAIDPIFNCSTILDEGGGTDYPFYWSGTTHANMVNGGNAAYVSFGQAFGWMEMPPNSGNYNFLDVHGAGAQRSDPKSGDPANWPYGHGPQGDVIRIYNYVRLVRDVSTATGVGDNESMQPGEIELGQNYPNPFNPVTTITFTLGKAGHTSLKIFNVLGELIATLVDNYLLANRYQIKWEGANFASGVYYYTLEVDSFSETRQMIMQK